jgi:hypothetical protein
MLLLKKESKQLDNSQARTENICIKKEKKGGMLGFEAGPENY